MNSDILEHVATDLKSTINKFYNNDSHRPELLFSSKS